MMRVPEHWAWTRAERAGGQEGAEERPGPGLVDAVWNATAPGAEDDDSGRDERLAQVEVAVLGVLLVLTVLGNAVVLLALYARRRCGGRRKLSRMFYFILHLSVADMVTAFFSVLPQLAWKVTFRFHGGNFLCKAVKFGQPLGVYLSSYVLTATALDRYRAICHPLTYCSWSSSRARAMVGAAWGLSLLFCLPQVFIFSIEPMEGGYDCWATFVPQWGQRAYVTWYTCSVFMIPLAVLLFTYSRICCEIWRSASSKHAPTLGTCKTCPHVHAYAYRFAPHQQPAPVSSNSFAYARSQQQAAQRTNPLISRAKINTVKQTVLVIAIYIICSAPFICVQLWAAWGNADNPFFQGRYMTILTLMFSLNSCVNPWIYLAFNKDLVRMLWLLVSCQGGAPSGHPLSAHSGGSGSSQSNTTQHRTCFTDLANNHVPGPGTAFGRTRDGVSGLLYKGRALNGNGRANGHAQR
ncbi:cephalotocin receptor 1-like [Frankliniella occidentalis]|uniref:Cephalotocin receptor 1-like n=1 Tax=Frankliniella occidentalis TaxID=133901 RepID=A0A9C6TWP9_FRAOC|nr:cephalotocin receptor 1-like [Frankliniella occidentalis]